MRKYAADNLMFLRKEYPLIYNEVRGRTYNREKIKIEETRNGHPNLQIQIKDQGLTIYSKYDPYLEVSRWLDQMKTDIAEKQQVLLFGLGLGYHLEGLLERYPDKLFYIIEPDLEVFLALIESRDMEPILKHKNIASLSVGSDSSIFHSTINIISENVRSSFAFIIVPFYQRHYTTEIKKLRTSASELLLSYRGNIATFLVSAERWMENIIRNYPYVLSSPDLSILKDKFAGIPAIIVGSGPSLKEDIETIRKLQPHCIVLSAGTSLQALSKNGIAPDLSVSIDGSYSNYIAFKDIDMENIPLLFSGTVHHSILSKERLNTLYVSVSLDTVTSYLHPDSQSIPSVYSTASVTGTAIQAAAYMGCNPIVLAGQDMSYPNDTFYTEGVVHRTHEQIDEILAKANEKVENVSGGFNKTTEAMLNTLQDLQNVIQLFPDRTFINTSRYGAKIKGTTFQFMEDWGKTIQSNTIIPQDTILQMVRSHSFNETKKRMEKGIAKLSSFIGELTEYEDLFAKISDQLNKLQQANSIRTAEPLLNSVNALWEKILSNKIFDHVYDLSVHHQIMIYTRQIHVIANEKDTLKKSQLIVQHLGKIIEALKQINPKLLRWSQDTLEELEQKYELLHV
jgi:hypothetical protein